MLQERSDLSWQFRILQWNTGEIRVLLWRSWGWALQHMEEHFACHLQPVELELQLMVLDQLEHTPERPDSGPIMRSYLKPEHMHLNNRIKSCELIFSHQVCPFLHGTTVQWIDDQKVPYATNGHEWVGFDNKESIETKVNMPQRFGK